MFIMVSRRGWGDGDSFLTINVVCRYTLLNFCEGEKKLGGGLKNAMYKKKKRSTTMKTDIPWKEGMIEESVK